MSIKYVVREGLEKDKGRYLIAEGVWSSDREEAFRYYDGEFCGCDLSLAVKRARECRGRVIPVTVRKVPRKVRVTRRQLELAAKAHYETGIGALLWESADTPRAHWLACQRAALTALGFEVEP
jgi:hypothetical protein